MKTARSQGWLRMIEKKTESVLVLLVKVHLTLCKVD
jgi:hypothetical protein